MKKNPVGPNRENAVPALPCRTSGRPESRWAQAQNKTAVLVVDDEPLIADTMAAILEMNGFAASAAYSPEQALQQLRYRTPELVISDVVMPGMSGIELAITIRESYPSCQILLFSGNATTEDLLADARRRGYNFPLLSKPVSPPELLSFLSGWGLPRVVSLNVA